MEPDKNNQVLAIPSALSSERLPTMGALFGLNDARMVTARLAAAFGDHRVSDSWVRDLWLRELVETFAGYTPEIVNKAMGGVIRKCKFWPAVAEILEAVKGEIPPPQLPKFKDPIGPDLTPADVSHRVKIIADAKRKFGYSPAFDSWDDTPPPPPADPVPYVVERSDVTPSLRDAIVRDILRRNPAR